MRWLIAFMFVGCSRPTDVVAKADPTPVVKPAPTPGKGVIRRSCAPWDGPALEVLIGDGVSCTAKPASYFRLNVYHNLPLPLGETRRWLYGTNVDNGHATRIVAGGFEEWIGSLSLTHESGEKYRAELNLTGPKKEHLEESVDLTLCPGTPMCG